MSCRTKKIVQPFNGECSNCERFKSQTLAIRKTSGKDFMKRRKSNHGHCSATLNPAWIVLNSIGTVLMKLYTCLIRKQNLQ